MSNTLSTLPQKISKKEARKLVYEKLAVALAEYKDSLKEKRFISNLKKASRLFAADIAKTIGRKKEKAVKKPKKMKPVATEAKAKEAS
ncbi:MAG: hypothetical protein ABL876_07095 [Chitinophagaceae bacterium]